MNFKDHVPLRCATRLARNYFLGRDWQTEEKRELATGVQMGFQEA